MSALTDVNVSSLSNSQVLSYNTATSKWINSTLPSGVTTLSALSDVNVSSLVSGNLLVYDSSTSKWLNSDTIPDNILFIKDDTDGTKKLQLQLSSISAGTTRILTVPDANTTIVGTNATQTLTNKTLTDSTNNVMAKSLKSATTTIDVSAATAPSVNQALIATSSTAATWQQVDHTDLSNIGTNTHAQIDTFIGTFGISTPATNDILRYIGGVWTDSGTLTAAENNINNLLVASIPISNEPNVAQNTQIVTSYTDSSDGYVLNVNNSSVGPYTISSFTKNTGTVTLSGGNLLNINATFGALFLRLNVNLGVVSSPIYSITLTTTNTSTSVGHVYVYGSNNNTTYTNTTNTVSGGTLLVSESVQFQGWSHTYTITNTSVFQYIHLLITGTVYAATVVGTMQIFRPAGSYTGMVNGTDYSVSTDSTTGNPKITYLNSTSNNLTYSFGTLGVYELYRRLYPVVRDTNTIKLTDGTNTATLTSTAGYPLSKASDVTITTPISGNLLLYNGSAWINSDTIPDNLLFVKDDVDGTKKMQFQLSGITTGTTRTLTVPDASCTLIGDTNTQTITNKTFRKDASKTRRR